MERLPRCSQGENNSEFCIKSEIPGCNNYIILISCNGILGLGFSMLGKQKTHLDAFWHFQYHMDTKTL